MTSFELRKKFFDYFVKHQHTLIASSSLIPAQDPTLLFANAGMNQFKDVFLGKEERSYKRAVSIQKCIRAGGKHNDLENVGFTKRHLTFFEMMGNFSFGDYFKKEAIEFAWKFLTEDLKLDKNLLSVSVHYKDDEAYALWHTGMQVPEDKIFRLGDEENFWQMGDTGPCGPCTEIFVDRGPDVGCGSKTCSPADGCDRFLEVWNLVFMQYNRLPDGSDKPLSKTGVDTGMGLERLCAIMQKKDSVFETDLFAPLITRMEELTGLSYAQASPEIQGAFRVLADHIRSTCSAIADGGTPSNEGRGYVIRKIIRRAALFAQKLGNEHLFEQTAPAFITFMSPIYPELKTQESQIISLLKSEVEKFRKTFLNGQQMLEAYFKQAKDKRISGKEAFKLYDTYGFPLELTKVMAQEKGFTVDTEEFEREMEVQRERSGKKVQEQECELDQSIITQFTGYEERVNEAKILALIIDKEQVHDVQKGTMVHVVTNISPFFVACGGQVNDQGFISKGEAKAPLRGLKNFGNATGVLIEAPTALNVGDTIILEVDSPSRIRTMSNHTATHMLQAALIELLGKQVRQSGSVVTPDYLRFDFTYHENLTQDQIKTVEARVNQKIVENIPVIVTSTTLKEATDKGVIAIFGEKYQPEKVRVIDIPGFSAELCGGTHVGATGDIGCFKITEVSSLSAGNRRIVAVTGPAAVELFQNTFNFAKTLGTEFKVPIDKVVDAVMKQKEQLKKAQSSIKALKKELYSSLMESWVSSLETVNGLPFLYLEIDAQQEDLKDIAQALLKKKPGFYFLVGESEERLPFFTTLDQTYSDAIDINKFAAWLKEHGIAGGLRGTSVQGSIPLDIQKLKESIKNWIISSKV